MYHFAEDLLELVHLSIVVFLLVSEVSKRLVPVGDVLRHSEEVPSEGLQLFKGVFGFWKVDDLHTFNGLF